MKISGTFGRHVFSVYECLRGAAKSRLSAVIRLRALELVPGPASRKIMKLSQEELGFEARLHRTYISQIECRERNVSVNAIEKLAKALKVRPGEIVDPPPKKATATKR